MKIALTTPTGHIGSQLAEKLLEARAELVLLCRDPDKVSPLTARGARAEAGNLTDGEYVGRATRGVDALFWLTPSDFGAPDMHALQAALGRNAANAVRQNGIKRVVNLSSIGAQIQKGTGPVAGLHRVENILNETGASVTHLRAGYFYENYLLSLDTIRSAGSIFLPVRGERRIPMVATQDIAQVAATCLLDAGAAGTTVRGVQGAKDLSFDEAAGILSEVLGKPVRHVKVAPDQLREGLLAMGASPDAAAKYVEMYTSMDDGTFQIAEPRSPETTTPTAFSDFARRVIKPILG